MTTTLPEPTAGTDAGARGDAGHVVNELADLRATADRLAAMPRSWAPSITELLEEEPRRHDDRDARDSAPQAPGTEPSRPTLATHPSLVDLDRVLDALAANDARLATLHAERAVLLARAARLAEALEHDLLDQDDPTTGRATSARRLELARRAVTAEIATTLHLGEHAAGDLTDHAVTLTGKAPATLAALRVGRLSWAHATAITKHLASLTAEEAAVVERSVLTTVLRPATSPDPGVGVGAITCTPAQVARRARRARETAHPIPVDVRHAAAARQRAVFLDDGHDGMAWLVAHLPAPLAHAAFDRLTRTARHLATHDGGRGRPLAQARADTLAALLLDDGTLDLRPTPQVEPAEESDRESTGATGEDPVTIATLARSIRPQVTVTVPVLTLLGVTDAPALLDGHVPIDPDTASRLTALAPSLRRILTDPASGAVLSVGRTAYAVPADLKALVRERDRTCRFPGCTRPARQADIDHTTAWNEGGATDAANLAVLCRRHHVLKHASTWQVRQLERTVPRADARVGESTGWGGTLEWTSPTGRRYVTRAQPVETTRHRRAPHGHEPPDDPPCCDPPF